MQNKNLKFISLFMFLAMGTTYADSSNPTANGLRCQWKHPMIPNCWNHLELWGDSYFEIRTAPCGPYVTQGTITCRDPLHCNQSFEMYTQDDYTAPSLFASITLNSKMDEGTLKFPWEFMPEIKITCSSSSEVRKN